MVELEAAAEDVAAAELAELVAAARLKVAAEAEVPVAVAEEGGSARAGLEPGSLRIASRAKRSASPAKACPASGRQLLHARQRLGHLADRRL